MALLFVFLIGADLVCPPDCCEARHNTSGSIGLSAGSTLKSEISIEAKPTSTQQEQCDEDCCFACAHVLPPIALTDIAVLDVKSPSRAATNRHLSAPPLRNPDHPPRLA
jgi:hypothetical protein